VVSFTHPPLYPRVKSSMYPLDRRLCESGRGEEEKNAQSLPGTEPPNSNNSARSQSLNRLSYPGSSAFKRTALIYLALNNNCN
jgi:hypothetical protein